MNAVSSAAAGSKYGRLVSSPARTKLCTLLFWGAGACVVLLSGCAGVLNTGKQSAQGNVPAPAPATVPAPVPANGQTQLGLGMVAPELMQPGGLIGPEWRLIALARGNTRGESVLEDVPLGEGASGGKVPLLRWISAEQVQGSGGCNRFSGRAVLTPDTVRFGPLASTRMACIPEPSSREDRFFKALELTQRAQLQGAVLRLLDGNGAELARFTRN